MRNYVGRIHCRHCATSFEFKTSKRAKSNFMLGDYILKKKSLVDKFEVLCERCYQKIPLQSVIKNGQLVAYERGDKEINLSEYKEIPNGSYSLFPYEKRLSMFMGEDTTQIIDLSDFPLSVGFFINVFGKKWDVEKIFKEIFIESGESDTFVCEVSEQTNKDKKRLLVLKDNYFPVLKEVNWRKVRKTGNPGIDNLKELCRYSLPEGKELVLCLDDVNFLK